jgi:O-phosphoseryl-tRNA(Cys) synthetase
MYKSLKNLLATIKRANLNGDNSVRISIAEANEIQNEIAVLLLDIKNKETSEEKIIDGGGFE